MVDYPTQLIAVTQPNLCGIMSLLNSGGAFATAVLTDAVQLGGSVTTAVDSLLNLPNVIEGIVQNDVQVLADNLTNIAANAINTLVSHLTAQLTNMVNNLNMAVAQAGIQAGLLSSGCSLPSAPPTQANPCGNMQALFGSVMGLGSTLISEALSPIDSLAGTIAGLTNGTITDIASALGSMTNAVASVANTATAMTSMVEAEVAAQAAALSDMITFTVSNNLTSLIGNPCAASVLGMVATDALLSHLLPFADNNSPPWADPPPIPPAAISDLGGSDPGEVFNPDGSISTPIGQPPTSTSITLTWTNPTTGSPPFFYQVQYRIAGTNAAFTNYGPLLENVTFETINGLQPNTTYDFQVITTNTFGHSTSDTTTLSTISALSGAPTADLRLAVTAVSNNAISLSWTPPSGGTQPFTFQVRYRPNGALFWTDSGSTISDTFATVSGLSAAALYDFSIVTHNSVTTSTSAAISAATLGFVAPSVPQNAEAKATAGGASLASAFSGLTRSGRGSASGSATVTAASNFVQPQAPYLPTGPLYTTGSQITDANGNPVRICAVTWMGAHNRNAAPMGLDQINYKTLISHVMAAGFNTIRIATCDAAILNNDAVSNINYTINPELISLPIQSVLVALVNYCGTIGLKVIVDSHNNDGGQLQQPNGLWYDVGGTSNETDGSSTTGTISDSTFVSVWRIRASLFKGKPAVIGYEIRQRPKGSVCTWGDNGTNDLRSLYQRVGNAIQAIDSNPLIICAGPQNTTTTYSGTGTAPEGDLTNVVSKPVSLTVGNKVVYAVYCYPNTISGLSVADTGPSYISRLQTVWGSLISNGTAPVWVAECGAGMQGTDETDWGATFLSFIGGTASGGPSFTSPQQPIGISWYDLETLTSSGSGQHGLLTTWSPVAFDATQETYWSQTLFGTTP
jgi:hypothetical protein